VGVSPYLLVLIVSLVAAAFAASAETALNTVSRIRMRSLAEAGDRRARVVVNLHSNPNAYLSTILTLNTVAVIISATSAVYFALNTFPQVPEGVVTAILALITLVYCEIAPKSLALRYNDRLALVLARPVAFLTTVLHPVVSVLNWIGTVPLRILTRNADVRGPFVTEHELKMLVAVGEQQGVVEHEEREMIQGVLELTDKLVREIMVPRVDVVAIAAEATLDDVIQLIIDTGHSRIPVYEGSIDQIVGVVYAKDLLRYLPNRGTPPPRRVRDIAREPYFTPEVKRAGELLQEMQKRNVHMAIVVDEYGGTAGIITLEDLTEEILGPIRDEYDVQEPEEVQFISDHEVLMNARVPIDDVKELLHLDIADSEADSIGGLVYERLGDIPKVGDTVKLGDATLVVESVRRQAIQAVRIISPRPFVLDHNGTRQQDETSGEHAAASVERDERR
jgi:CBS domain containing-hemolysin-like protein